MTSSSIITLMSCISLISECTPLRYPASLTLMIYNITIFRSSSQPARLRSVIVTIAWLVKCRAE